MHMCKKKNTRVRTYGTSASYNTYKTNEPTVRVPHIIRTWYKTSPPQKKSEKCELQIFDMLALAHSYSVCFLSLSLSDRHIRALLLCAGLALCCACGRRSTTIWLLYLIGAGYVLFGDLSKQAQKIYILVYEYTYAKKAMKK